MGLFPRGGFIWWFCEWLYKRCTFWVCFVLFVCLVVLFSQCLYIRYTFWGFWFCFCFVYLLVYLVVLFSQCLYIRCTFLFCFLFLFVCLSIWLFCLVDVYT